MSRVEENKLQKKKALLDTAFSLFVDHGFIKTSVADITKKAGVAKGTFYLYFSDKYDIRDKLIARKAADLLRKAWQALEKRKQEEPESCQAGTLAGFEDDMIFLIDRIVTQLDNNKMLLNFVSKNLEWGVFKHAMIRETDDIGFDVPEIYNDMLEKSGRKFRDPELMLFMILELVGSTIHNVILYKEPVTLEVLRPELYQTIRLIIREQDIGGR